MRHAASPPRRPEAAELADEIRCLFDDIDRAAPPMPGATGESSPALDVIETNDAIEVVVDVPGVAPHAIRVVLRGGILIIAGSKQQAPAGRGPGDVYHLVERGFGRFARVVHINAAIDGSRARAALRAGELRIVVPRIAERRGRQVHVPIEDAT
jgi:HSP20 family protein